MTVYVEAAGVRSVLAALDRPCYVVEAGGRVGVSADRPGQSSGARILAVAPPVDVRNLGASAFLDRHRLRHPYMAGSMAAGISSVELVTALAHAGHLASFGAAGLAADRVETAVRRLRRELPDLPWASSLIHSPAAPRAERDTVEVYLRNGVTCVEASAFIAPTRELVRYRATGLRSAPDGGVLAGNRVIAKVSRAATAESFLRPAPAELVADLVAEGRLTPEQAALAARVPLADDITVEADSAGHTDRRPLVTQLPLIIALRDREARSGNPGGTVAIGAAGGIGTPQAAFAAFAMGAAYIVTGSINQGCLESGTSPQVKALLATADIADCTMAPAADMFEIGAEVQVLKRGTLFPGRAAWLHRLYRAHSGLDDLPVADRRRLEEQILRRPVEEAWLDVAGYLRRHRPDEADRADRDPKARMALLFRWYLGLSSRWATSGDPGRTGDYQIWCGPSMGAFNDWTHGSSWEDPGNRRVADVAGALLHGAAYHSRLAHLRLAGVRLPAWCTAYAPTDGAGPGHAPAHTTPSAAPAPRTVRPVPA